MPSDWASVQRRTLRWNSTIVIGIVDAAEIRLPGDGEVRLVKIENKGNGEDRDDDHEPFVVLAHYGDHKERNFPVGEGLNLRRVASAPTAFCYDFDSEMAALTFNRRAWRRMNPVASLWL